MSTLPKCLGVPVTSASTSSRREMLQGMTWASPPAFLMPSATSWQASALRLEITTFAPSFASSSAEERPMPRLEPVMMATFPVRSNGVFFIVVLFLTRSLPVIARSTSDEAIHLSLRDAMDCFATLAMTETEFVIPGWSEGPDLRCAVAHRGISRFRVRCCASPRNDEGEFNKKACRHLATAGFFFGAQLCGRTLRNAYRNCEIGNDA